MIDNVYMLSDKLISDRISASLKSIRLKQNISRQDLAERSGVSVSSIARMEDGEIKSFDSLLRLLRILGKMDVLLPLIEEPELSPREYYIMMQNARLKERKRASGHRTQPEMKPVEW